jgi:Ca2+-binding EF-hand superfamily protein
MLDLYVRSEFKAMDSDKDDKLSRKEVRNLLRFMGFKNSKNKLKVKSKKVYTSHKNIFRKYF